MGALNRGVYTKDIFCKQKTGNSSNLFGFGPQSAVCFAIILCQLCRNSLPRYPRNPGEFPCSTKKFSFTVCRNTLPKVQIATYALPKNLSHFFWAQSSGICLFLPFSRSLLYGEAAKLCDNRSAHRLFGYFSPFFRLFYDKSKSYIKAKLQRTKRNKEPLLSYSIAIIILLLARLCGEVARIYDKAHRCRRSRRKTPGRRYRL